MAETDELIVVHKPASIPVHVSGQYRKNTVMALLQVERPDLGRLFPVHRLDKPVSGLLLIAKTAAAANDVRTLIMVRSYYDLPDFLTPLNSQQDWSHVPRHQGNALPSMSCSIHPQSEAVASSNSNALPTLSDLFLVSSTVSLCNNVLFVAMSLHDIRQHVPVLCASTTLEVGRQALIHRMSAISQGLGAQDQNKVQKAYIARVLGMFPTESVTVNQHLAWDSRSNHAFLMNDDGGLAEKQSLGSVPVPCQSQQLQAKEAQTSFKLRSVSPDGKTSLVECMPKTGRTHQIRCPFQAYAMWHVVHGACCSLHICCFACQSSDVKLEHVTKLVVLFAIAALDSIERR